MCECRRWVTASVAIFSRLWPCRSSQRVYATAMCCPGPPNPYGAVNCVAPWAWVPGRFWYVPLGLCIARQTTAYRQTPASSALTACWTAPPMFTVSTWTCQERFGSFSIAIMQLTDTMVMPSTTACPVAGSSGYVASPSMSDMASPESSTAPFTASSACAARGISAERVTREKPTPLTATLHRCSHMRQISLRLLRVVRQPELRQRDVVVQRCEDHLHATPHLRLRVRSLQQIASQQRSWCVVELHDDARVRDCRGKSAVTGVVHDRVGVDGALAADGFEREVDRHAVHAGRVRRMLEVSARLAALQRQHAAPGRFPEWFRPFVRDRNWPGHLAPVAQEFLISASACSRTSTGWDRVLPRRLTSRLSSTVSNLVCNPMGRSPISSGKVCPCEQPGSARSETGAHR